jgi:cell pole-organizing protein PopZ
MSESKGQHEPSMEEILASIRRIIAEDGEQPAAAPAVVPAAPATAASEAPQPAVAAKGEEILELTEVVQEEEHRDPPMPPPAPQDEPPSVSAAAAAERLVSDAAAAASIAALSQIHQLGPTNEKRMSDIPVGEGQRTIEDMVREMLRPLLKEWLDSNLPHLVERVVQEEVSRLVRDVQRR